MGITKTLDERQRAADLATFRAPPVRPAYERLGIYPAHGAFFFDDHSGTYRLVYERGHLPTPGAMAYAYMSLGLAPKAVCGAGFDVQGPGWRAFQPPQTYQPMMTGVQGLPTSAGQVITAPLTGDVNGGRGA